MTEQQPISTDEAEERELEEAEKQFEEENKTIAAQQSGGETKEEKAKRYQDILIALDFTCYDNKEKGIACKLKAGQLLIGRTFTEQHPIGNMWVQCLSDGEHGKKGEFLKRDECKQISQVALFYRIRDGELSIPEPTVIGKVVGKSEKAVQIQFEEFGQRRIETWGFGALKRNEEGVTYIPASYSKETEKYNPKMQVPRNIIINDYEAELEKIPLTQTDMTKEKDAQEEKVEKGTIADKIPHKEPATLAEGEKPTVDYYVSLIGEITEKVGAEERIPSKEQGYAINMVFNAITRDTRTTLIAELKNGGE